MRRDIPDYELKPHVPKNPTSWYKVYKKLKNEASKAAADAEAVLKATLSGIKSMKEENLAEVVSTERGNALYSSTNAPGPSRRGRIMYNYMSGRTGSKGANRMTLMEKIRKEAKSAKTGVMGRPMHELQKKHNGVVKAPAQFVEDVKRMKVLQQVEAKKALTPPPKRPLSTTMGPGTSARTSKPPMHAPGSRPPKPRPQPAAANGLEPYDLTSDREARLRALKAGKPIPSKATVPDSELTPSPTSRAPRLQSTGDATGTLTLDFLESDSDSEPVKSTPKRTNLRQREEDDALFGRTTTPSVKRKRDIEDDSGLPRKVIRPVSDEDVSPPPQKLSRPSSGDNISPAHKLLKPTITDAALLARSRSPLTLSPASSPRLQPIKKRQAPSLFMKRK
jgi:elongin-A